MDWNLPENALELLTDKQKELVKLRAQGVSLADCGKQLGNITRSNVCAMQRRIIALLRKHGFDPARDITHTQAHPVSGVSTLYDDQGQIKMQWVKTKAEQEAQEDRLRAFVDELTANIKPAKPKAPAKGKKHDPELMSAIVIGDMHVGMTAYQPETKHSNFDTDIATADIRAAIDDLIGRSPDAETGLLVDVGDAMHMDSSHNTTFKGTPVDVDTRYHRVMRALAMTMRYGVDRMLEKYKRVIVVVARGNHNEDSAIAIQLMLEFYYEKEPRVNVLPTQGYFHHIEFGKWLIGVHHGDKVKAQKLVNIMARDLPEAWGRTEHRLWMVGHFHHDKMVEIDGCKVKTFGTLAPPDGWHASQGYASESTMELLTFKKSGGMHSTLIYNIPRPKQEADVRIA